MNEAQALSLMHQALSELNTAKIARGSRELSIAATELETAMLWLKRDLELKTPRNREIAA